MALLPPGTMVRRMGADLRVRFPDGTELVFTDWAHVADAVFDSRGARVVDESGCELPEAEVVVSGAATEATSCSDPWLGGIQGPSGGATAPSLPAPAVVSPTPATTAVIGAGVLLGLGAAAGGGGGGGGGIPPAASTTTSPSGIELDAASDSGVRGDQLTNDATPTLTGKADANATITIRNASGSTIATTIADATGGWSATPGAALSDGVANLQVIANRGAGAADSPAVSITLTIDTAAPSAPVAILDPGADSGSSGDNVTNDPTPAISGSGTAGDTIRVTLPGGAVLVTTVAPDGTWSVTPSDAQALPTGPITLSVTATDPAGNVSRATLLTINVDRVATAPTSIDLSESSDTGRSNADNVTTRVAPTVTGSGAEPGATVTLYDTDGTTVLGLGLADASGNWSITSINLSEGVHTLTARQTDPAGNTSAPTAGLVVTIDTIASVPSAPDLLQASDSGEFDSDNLTRDTTPSFRGTGAESGATVTLYDTNGLTVLGTGVADGSGSWSITSITLVDGSYTLRVRQTDLAGNTSSFRGSLGVTVDTSAAPPSAPDLADASDSGASSTDDVTSVTNPRVTGTGAESGAVVTLYDTDGTTVLGTGTADGGGNWSITSTTLSVGIHVLTARQTDRAGNMSSASEALVVTIEPAVLPFTTADLVGSGELELVVDADGALRLDVQGAAGAASASVVPVAAAEGTATANTGGGSALDLLLSAPEHAGSSLASLC